MRHTRILRTVSLTGATVLARERGEQQRDAVEADAVEAGDEREREVTPPAAEAEARGTERAAEARASAGGR